MKKLKKLEIANWITYPQAVLKLYTKGKYVIHGKNLDRPSKDASNGAGKSLIVGVLSHVRYGAAPTPMKAKKMPKAGFVKGTEQKAYVEDEHGNEFVIHKYFKGSSKLDIIKNKKNLKFREKHAAQARLEKLLPQNEEQFFSLTYLDTKRPPILQYGTDAQRHHFIEALFQLDVYDKLGALVKADWQKTQVLIQELEILDRQLSEKEKDKVGDPVELKAEQERLQKKTREISKTVSDLLAELQQCRTFIALADGVDTSQSLDEVESQLKSTKVGLKGLRSDLEEAVAQNTKHEAYLEHKANEQKLKEKLLEYTDVKLDKTLPDKIREDTQLLDTIEETEDNNRRYKERKKEIKAEMAEMNMLEGSIREALEMGLKEVKTAYVRNKTRLEELKANYQDTWEHLENHDDSKCPICSSLISDGVAEKILEEKQSLIDSTVKIMKQSKRWAKYLILREEYNEVGAKVVPNPEDADVIRARIEENKELVQKMRRKILLKNQLKELPEVEDVKVIVDTDNLQSIIERRETKLAKLQKTFDSLNNLKKLDIKFTNTKEAKRRKNDIEEALGEYQPLLDKIQAKFNKVSVNATRSESVVEEIEALSGSITNLKLKTADHKIKTVLRKAFGPKGIRKQRVAEIGATLEVTLNEYASLLYDFPIRFELVISETKFQILAHRNNSVSDIRELSGAESRCFTLLLLITLLRYCPDSMRLDTVILDEIEANMDRPFRERYISQFLPELQKVVPKIVIVTPLSEKEFFIPKAKVFVAVKKDGISTLQAR